MNNYFIWIIYFIIISYIIYSYLPKKFIKENLDVSSIVKTATSVANVAVAATTAATNAAVDASKTASLPTQDINDPCNFTNLLCKPIGGKDGDTKGCPLTCAGNPETNDLKCRVAPNFNKSSPCGECSNYMTLTTDTNPYCAKN